MGDPGSSTDLRAIIDRYVERLKQQRSIRSETVERVFRRVPRHRLVDQFFVPNKLFSSQAGYREVTNDPNHPQRETLELIYSDNALVTRLGNDGEPTSSTSMPGLVADMLELLRLEPGQRVLEVGAGTGYNAALISEIVASQHAVVTVDIQPDVVEQARRLLRAAGYADLKVLARDGFFGVPEEAPFDRIIATVGLFDLSPHWPAQLSFGGEMLLPVYQGGAAPLLRVREQDRRLVGNVVGMSGFMPIQGEMRPEGPSENHQEPASDLTVTRLPGWGFATDADRWNFWFFVTASDARGSLLPVPGADDGDTWSKWTFGLGDGSARVVIGEDELVELGMLILCERDSKSCAKFGSRAENRTLRRSSWSSYRGILTGRVIGASTLRASISFRG